MGGLPSKRIISRSHSRATSRLSCLYTQILVKMKGLCQVPMGRTWVADSLGGQGHRQVL